MKTVFPFIFSALAAITISAQSSADSSTFKAAYLESGPNFFPKGRHLGATLLAHGNWFIAGRLGWTDEDAPQLPDDYREPTATYSGPGASSCSFCIDLDFDFFGGTGKDGPDTEKHVRIFSASVGYLFQLRNPNLRLRAEAGVARMRVQNAVDFVYVPDSVEDLGSEVTLTKTSGYSFTREERKMTGLFVGAGAEFPLNKWLGFSTGITAAFAKGEKQVGLNMGLLAGLLR